MVLNVAQFGVVYHVLDLGHLGPDALHLPVFHLLDLLQLGPHVLQVVVELIRVDIRVLVHRRLRGLLFGAVRFPKLTEVRSLLLLELALVLLLLFVARGRTGA